MSEQSKAARPSQVTMAGWLAVVGSALIVLTVFDTVTRLRTVEFRDAIAEFLSTPPGNGLGLDTPQVVEILRVLMFFNGAASAAAMVLAIYVLQRNNGARIGFTVAAAAIMVTAPAVGGFLPVVIAFAAIMLWTRPARDWFAGRPVTQAGPRSGHPSRVEGSLLSSENHPPQEDPGRPGADDAGHTPGTPPPSWPRMPEGSADRPVPPPTQGYGSPHAQTGPPPGSYPQGGPGGPYGQQPPPYGQRGPGGPYGQQPPPYGQQPPPYGQQPPPYGQQPPPYGQQPPPHPGGAAPYGYPPQYAQPGSSQPYYGQQRPADPDARPTTVVVAAWITWALSALALLGFVIIAIVVVAAREEFLRQIQQDPTVQDLNVTGDEILAAMWVVGLISLFWGVAAMVLAWFAYRRANWARITLVVSAAMALLFGLAALPVSALHVLGSGAVIALLFTGGANEWYSRRSGTGGYPGPFQPYGSPGQEHGGPSGPQYGGQAGPPGPPAQQPPSPNPADQQPPRDRDKGEPPSNVW